MKTINHYKFKNKKIVRLSYISDKDRKKTRIPRCDNILFDWSFDNGKNFREGLYMRPDEALTTAKQLIDAVWKITGGYKEELLKGYNGYKEFNLK